MRMTGEQGGLRSAAGRDGHPAHPSGRRRTRDVDLWVHACAPLA